MLNSAASAIENLVDLQRQISSEAANSLPRKGAFPHAEVLEAILEQVTVVDFREAAGLTGGDKKPQSKHYLITTAEEVLTIANRNHWGLQRHHALTYVFNGAYWKPVDDDELKSFLQKAAEKMGVDRFDARYARFANNLQEQFSSSAYKPVRKAARDVVKINLANGTFHIQGDTQELRPHSSSDFLTHQLAFVYDPTATAPLFHRFLDQVLPDRSCQQILAEYLGYLFVPAARLKLEKALLLYGTGANGKSVFFEVVTALLGSENVSNFSLQSLTAEASTSRPHLAHVLVNYASEINGKMETNVFKQLVSGEQVEARLLYGQSYSMRDYGKLIFNCNELPVDVEHTAAYFRRFLIVPFTKTIPEAEQDKQLAAKIVATELSGVFNWVLDGLRRLLRQQKFTESAAVAEQIELYKLQSDSVRSFLHEFSYAAHPEQTVTRQVLFEQYREFCIQEGYRPVGGKNFTKRLENQGITGTRRSCGHVHFISRSVDPFSVK
jgi:putative DNA primase/helicase